MQIPDKKLVVCDRPRGDGFIVGGFVSYDKESYIVCVMNPLRMGLVPRKDGARVFTGSVLMDALPHGERYFFQTDSVREANSAECAEYEAAWKNIEHIVKVGKPSKVVNIAGNQHGA